MSTPESYKSPKHERVTQAITAAVAVVSKAPAQMVIAAAFKALAPAVTAPKALEKMAFMAPE